MNKRNIVFLRDEILESFIEDFLTKKLTKEEKDLIYYLIFTSEYIVPTKLTYFQMPISLDDEFSFLRGYKEECIVFKSASLGNFIPLYTSKEAIPKQLFEDYNYSILKFMDVYNMQEKVNDCVINPFTQPFFIDKENIITYFTN